MLIAIAGPPIDEVTISDGAKQSAAALKVWFQLDMATVTTLGTPPVTTPTSTFGAQLAPARSPGVEQADEMETASKEKTRPINIKRMTRRIFVFTALLLSSVTLRWPSLRCLGILRRSSRHNIVRWQHRAGTLVHSSVDNRKRKRSRTRVYWGWS